MGKEIEKPERTEVWERNHESIMEAYWKLRSESPLKTPSNTAIAQLSGLSRPTVIKHMREMELSDGATQIKKFRDDVLNAVSLKAIQGDVLAAKLYFQLAYGWTEKTEVKNEIISKTLQISFTSDLDKKEDEKESDGEVEIIE